MMVKNILFVGVLLIAFGCDTNTRYTQHSIEIEVVKSNIGYYVEGDWEPYEASYAESATIFFNTSEENPATIQEIIAGQKLSLEPLSSYSFDREKDFYEMVLDDDGETWVNYWGLWKGTIAASGESFEMPVHLTSQFVDGKIVKTHGYWDASALTMALTKIREAAEAQVVMEMQDESK
jgi:ketosteroid isomerase-like protein